jgi:parvulin-like peptidyl-prolyl isomerase
MVVGLSLGRLWVDDRRSGGPPLCGAAVPAARALCDTAVPAARAGETPAPQVIPAHPLNKLLLVAFVCLAPLPPVLAADREAIVATVGDEPIRAGEVERLVAKATRGKKSDPAALQFLQSRLLEEIVARRLVLAYARRNGDAATADELATERAALKTQLAARRRSIDDFLKAESLGQAGLERQFAWNVVWRKYVARYATEERLAAYFAAHRHEFDGTQFVVSHILLRPSPGEAKTAEDVLKQAAKIRQEIIAGKLTFAEAARKYSTGPSSKDDGHLGSIGRHSPMDESFSRAAFALEVGQVSQPVKTAFGVHLIRCDEIKPGAKKLADVRKELEDALSLELLDKLSKTERRFTPVKYTGLVPPLGSAEHSRE